MVFAVLLTAKCIGSSHQLETGLFSHDRITTKGPTNGREMVIGHVGPQEALSSHMPHKDGELDHMGLKEMLLCKATGLTKNLDVTTAE